MAHPADLNELTQIVSKYVDQYNLLVAGGPLAATGVVRTVVGKNKMVNIAVGGAAAWFAIQELSGPMLGLIQDQFGNLQSVIGGYR